MGGFACINGCICLTFLQCAFSNVWIRGWLWYMWVVALISECGHHPAWLPLLIISRRHTINDTFPIGHMNAQCRLYIVHGFIILPTCHKEWLISDYRESGMGMLEENRKESEKRPKCKRGSIQTCLPCLVLRNLLGKTLRDSSYQSLSAL